MGISSLNVFFHLLWIADGWQRCQRGRKSTSIMSLSWIRYYTKLFERFFLKVVSLKNEQDTNNEVHFLFFKILLEDTSPFVGFGLLVTSALGFKTRADPSLACFLTCAQWIPQIHLWCDTCWLYSGQHGSRAFLTHILADVLQALVGLEPIVDRGAAQNS